MSPENYRPNESEDPASAGIEHQALAKFQDTLGADETWAAPPPSVARAVFDAISSESGERVRGETGLSWPRWAVGATVATGAVFVALLVAAIALLPVFGADPFTARLEATGVLPSASGVATIESTGAGWSILLDLDLPPAEEGHYYEGWVWNEAGEGVSIGTFHMNDAIERLSLWSGVDIEEYPMVWVSLQEIGGGAELSDRVVLRGSIDG